MSNMGPPSQDDSRILQLLDDFFQADHGSNEEKVKLDAVFSPGAFSSTANAKSFIVDGEADKFGVDGEAVEKDNDLCQSHEEISNNNAENLAVLKSRAAEAPNPSVCASESYSGIGETFGLVAMETDTLVDKMDSQPGPGGHSHMECIDPLANIKIDASWSEIYQWLNQDLSSPVGGSSHSDRLPLSSELPILDLSSRCNTVPSPQAIATHNGGLTTWQCGVMNYFGVPDRQDDELIKVFTSGGLLYRYNYSSTATMDIYDPITKWYKRLELPLEGPDNPVTGHRFRRNRRVLVWGIIVEKHTKRYQVIVQNWTVNGEATISQLLVYDSAADWWETVGPLAQGISDRVGDSVYSSTSSGGNLYFLTADEAAGSDAGKRPRLIMYDGEDKSIREIVPLPNFVGKGEPVLLEHNGDIIFVTRKKIQKKYKRRTTWAFFRVDNNSELFVQIKVMPPHEFTTLGRNIKTEVRCYGNGDRVYFYGRPKSNTRVIRVLVYDFVTDSWTWLPDFLWPENSTWCWDSVFPGSWPENSTWCWDSVFPGS